MRRGRLIACAACVAGFAIVAPASRADVPTAQPHAVGRPLTIPALQRWTPAPGRWRLGGTTRIVVGAHRGLRAEGQQLADDLTPIVGRHLAVATAGRAASGDIALHHIAPQRRLGREGYRLDVGRVLTISAPTRAGVFYGGRTLLQLMHQHRWVHRGHALDWPRYRQRGLMVDASRTIYPTGWVVRIIKQLALLKLNFLHLHLTDDQRWGIASHAFPGIVSKGAFSYADIHRILAVARRYHVTVVPEIEMPGHMAAFLTYHPSLELKVLNVVGTPHPTEYVTDKLDFIDPAARRDVRRLLDEYLRLFPGRYFDIGDDEVLPPAESLVFPQLVTYATKRYGAGATADDALHGFINWVDRIVRAHHKVLRIWNDQIATAGKVPVDRDVTVDWWTSVSPLGDTFTESPAELLAAGYHVLNAGWYPNYYTASTFPVAGKADMAGVYRTWQVNDFDAQELFTGQVLSHHRVPADSPRLLGDAMSIWGPLKETIGATARGIVSRLTVISQKTWGSRPPVASYADFVRLAGRTGAT